MIAPVDVTDLRDFAPLDVTQWWFALTSAPPEPGEAAVLEAGSDVTVMRLDQLATWLRANGLSPLARRVERTVVPPGDFLALFLGEPVRVVTLTRPFDETHPRSVTALGTLGLLGGRE